MKIGCVSNPGRSIRNNCQTRKPTKIASTLLILRRPIWGRWCSDETHAYVHRNQVASAKQASQHPPFLFYYHSIAFCQRKQEITGCTIPISYGARYDCNILMGSRSFPGGRYRTRYAFIFPSAGKKPHLKGWGKQNRFLSTAVPAASRSQ